MSLYDSIIQYEREEIKAVSRKLAEKNSIMRLSIIFLNDESIEWDIAKSQVLLDIAYNLKDSKISEQNLDYIANEFDKIDDQTYEFAVPTSPQLKVANKNLIKARVEFYQEIVKQEGLVETFEDAIRNQFGDINSYIAALQPVMDAEREYSLAFKKAAHLTASMISDILSATNEVRLMKVKKIFPITDYE